MKNLRKVLALVLVVAMMASLVISASALSAKDYTDYSEVVNKDAVAMLTELGIINGYPAGDFQPAGVVTRAEMAKMIYVVLNSGNDQAPTPDAQRYSDVYKGHWAEGYVAFCDDLGIIDGMGDGTFAPSAPVTGVQAAKMLLVAMGYDSAVEGFTGSNWDYGVLKAASAAGLFEGFTASVNEGCTRDNAALLVYNALIGDCVSYVGNTAVATGDTLIGTYYGLVAVTGVVVANEYANLFDDEPLAAGYTEIAFIGDQYVDLAHAIDPMIVNWADLLEYPVADLVLALKAMGDKMGGMMLSPNGSIGDIQKYLEVAPEEEALRLMDLLQQKVTVNDKDEYESYVYSVDTTLAQVGKTVTVYAKLKGNYEQFTNVVEYAKYDMFSGKTVGNVVEDDDCVVFFNEGAEFMLDGEFKVDENTRYFQNYAAIWADDDDYRVYAQGNREPGDGWDGEVFGDFDTYIGADEATSAVRGEYLYAIDVDGDGVVEIVLKNNQLFAVAQYDDYTETWTFDSFADEYFFEYDLVDWTGIEPEAIVYDGELADGAKVLVQPVDGTYYVTDPAVVKAVVDEVNYNTDREWYVVMEDGTKYYESGLYWAYDICDPKPGPGGALDVPNPDQLKEMGYVAGYFYNVEDMLAGTEYNCYLDDFGNIVAYEKAGGPPPMKEYFLVTGAAREVQSLAVTESVVFGARAAKELTVGIGSYYGARDGRGNDLQKSVNDLFLGSAASLDQYAAAYITFGEVYTGMWQFHNYINVFNVENVYNLTAVNDNIGGVERYGWRTTLVQAAFNEEGTVISDLEAPKGMKVWAPADLASEGPGGVVSISANPAGIIKGAKEMFIGNDTLIYIYLCDEETGEQNVITLTGPRDMPALPVGDPCDDACKCTCPDGWEYGVKNVYSVEGGRPGAPVYEEAVVVFELNVCFECCAGLPSTRVNNWVWVFDVTADFNGCQEVRAINGKGEIVTLYNDTFYNGKLDKEATGWYAYVASPDATCERTGHDNHVVMMAAGDPLLKSFYNVYSVSDQPDTKQFVGVDAMPFNGKYRVYTPGMGPDAAPEALKDRTQSELWFDLDNVGVVIAGANVGKYYNGGEYIISNYGTVMAVAPEFFDVNDGGEFEVYVLTAGDNIAAFLVVEKEDAAKLLSESDWDYLAGKLEVKETAVEGAEGVPMGGPGGPPPMA